jgi:sugar/nucleoside kinase (ribokinase family)
MVVVYGTVCRDRTHAVGQLPGPGGYVEIDDEADGPGGEAFNTALAVYRWGGDVRLVGNTLGSADLLRAVEESGLDTSSLQVGEHFEPVCDIYVTPDGQRTMFGRGFRAMPDWGRPEAALAHKAPWVAADTNHGEAARSCLARASAEGSRTYALDFVPPDDVPTDFWQSSTDWIGFRGDIQKNVVWLRGFVESRGGFAVLSDGANGFVAGGTAPGGADWPVRHYPPFQATLVVDSTGAGDVFRAGMLFGLDRGASLDDCLRFASAAGCLNCRALGATAGLPTREEIEAHIAAHPEVARAYAPRGA